MATRKNNAARILALVLLYAIFTVFAYYVDSFQTKGDVLVYRDAYERISGLGFLEGYQEYKTVTGGFEPLSYVLVKISSILFSHSTFTALTSVSLLHLSRKSLTSQSFLSFFVQIPFNFYFLVLCFSAERLKIGMLILLAAYIAIKKSNVRRIVYSLAILGHLQIIILFFAKLLPSCFSVKKRSAILIALTLIASSLLVPYVTPSMWAYLTAKAQYYSANNEISATTFLGAAVFCALSIGLCVSRTEKKEILGQFLILVIFIAILGKDRINFFCWLLYFFYATRHQQHLRLASIVVAIYFNIKGLGFLYDIFTGGDGFFN